MSFKRYAIYYTPAEGPFAAFGASWLGWDLAAGKQVAQPKIPDLPMALSEITQTPRKYGFHATIKPPFRLANGMHPEDLAKALEALVVQMVPIPLEGLALTRLGRFLALTPTGDQSQLQGLAAMVVETLDAFRAPPSGEELARRRATGLTPRQDALLIRWGYPYVMDQFRFHMTLTGKLPRDQIAEVETALPTLAAKVLPTPFVIDGLSLVGEAEDGHFHLIHRYVLSL